MRIIHTLLLAAFLTFAATASAQTPYLLPAGAFAEKLNNSPKGIVLDVRTPGEFEKGRLPKARNLNINDAGFDQGIAALDKNTPVFVYCLGGTRSAAAVTKLRGHGFTEVYELEGGILQWRRNNMAEEGVAPRGMTLEQFKALLHTDKLVLVDFYAEWCGPCKKMKPYLAEIEKEYAGRVDVVRIDTDQNPELTRAMQVSALPTLLLFKNGNVKWHNVGYVPKKTVQKQLK